MKKKIITLLTLIAFTGINAQKANFGIKGGINLSNFSGDLKVDSPKAGYNLGAFVFIKTSSKFAIQPEISYSSQGISDSGVIFKLNYVNIPVIFKYLPTDKVSFDFGPQIGFMSDASLTATDPYSKQSLTVDASKLFNSTDFGLNLGATINATQKLGISIRYNIGLSDVASKELKNLGKTFNGISDASGSNRILSLNLEYKF